MTTVLDASSVLVKALAMLPGDFSTGHCQTNGMSFGTRLRQAREAKGLTPPDLGRLVGAKSRGHVQQWEAGEIGEPKGALLIKLSDVLEVEARWLATGEGPMGRQGEGLQMPPVDPKVEGARLFKLRVQREPRWLGQAEEWLERELAVPQKRSEVWNELDWYEHLVANWKLERSKAKGGTELGVVIPPPVDEDAAARARAERLAAARARKG